MRFAFIRHLCTNIKKKKRPFYIVLYHSSIPLVMHSCITPLGLRKKPPVPLYTDYSIKKVQKHFHPNAWAMRTLDNIYYTVSFQSRTLTAISSSYFPAQQKYSYFIFFHFYRFHLDSAR